MKKILLKLLNKNNKKYKSDIELFLDQCRQEGIYFPGDGGGAMEYFLQELKKRNLLEIKEEVK